MTATSDGTALDAVQTITVTIDGVQMQVPKGTLAIRAAELLGIGLALLLAVVLRRERLTPRRHIAQLEEV